MLKGRIWRSSTRVALIKTIPEFITIIVIAGAFDLALVIGGVKIPLGAIVYAALFCK